MTEAGAFAVFSLLIFMPVKIVRAAGVVNAEGRGINPGG
jgi:hypothetical protein